MPSVSVPEIATGYGFANVNVTGACENAGTFPEGPPMVYAPSGGGAVADPVSGMLVESTNREPLEKPRVAGVNRIFRFNDWSEESASGRPGKPSTENGLPDELMPMFAMVAGAVP